MPIMIHRRKGIAIWKNASNRGGAFDIDRLREMLRLGYTLVPPAPEKK
jgi:hypothetical protein